MSSETYLDNGLAEANNGVSRPQTSSEKRSCWKNALDKKEAKNQVLFSLPIILTTVFYYLITLVSIMFAGHLGELDLAGATLANSWAIVTGFGLMTGLSGALDTLYGQSFGAEEYRMMGIYLQGSCIISLFFSTIVSVIWIYTEPILILLHQDRQIAMKAGLYMKYLIPGLFAYSFLQNFLRFLQAQPIVVPLLVFSLIPLCMHFGIAYCMIHLTALKFKGAPIAASVSLWISVLMLFVYVFCGKKFKKTWNGVSLESFYYILPNLKLALPSAAMVCLEYWAFEILVFSAGLMPNPNISTSLMAICVNTEAVAFMLIYGLSAAASTRVSNELGAGNVDRAKKAMVVTLELSILLDLAMVLALVLGHNIWAGFFSDSHSIRKEFASMTPFLAISIILDSLQGILSGVARGCGWQNLAAFANLGAFYFIGMPIVCVLGFKVKLHVKGLWIGLICGIFCQAAALSLITIRRKWTRADVSGSKNENPSPVVV